MCLRLRLGLSSLSGGEVRVRLSTALAERHPVHPVHRHLELLPCVDGVTARHPPTSLRLGLSSLLHQLQLQLHLWVHRDEHLLCRRRVLGLPWMGLLLLLLMLLLLLQMSRVLRLCLGESHGMLLLLLLLLVRLLR